MSSWLVIALYVVARVVVIVIRWYWHTKGQSAWSL